MLKQFGLSRWFAPVSLAGGTGIGPADYGCGTAGWRSGLSAVGRLGSWAGPLPWLPAGGRMADRSPKRGRWLFDWCSARKTKAIITASEAEMAEIMMTSSAADIALDINPPREHRQHGERQAPVPRSCRGRATPRGRLFECGNVQLGHLQH